MINVKNEPVIIAPQEGPQYDFLKTSADVCVYGGAAGGGKTYGLLLSAVRHIDVKGYGFTVFRKNHNQIFAEGGLWDEAARMFNGIQGAEQKTASSSWVFNNRKGQRVSKISFKHIESDNDLYKWQGSQICGMGFDELTHFSEKCFFFMLSRNRSTCGVVPFVRATCNPDADSWVAKLIEWWIDQDTGYPIPERSGVIRYFIRRDEVLYWADTREELIEQFNLKTQEELQEPKSFTFIMSSVYDNKALLKVNPQYLANLKALSLVDRERLLYGNWKIKAMAGLYFKREQVELIAQAPRDIRYYCRAWDIAATEDKETGDPDYTAGVLMGIRADKTVVVLDVINRRIKAGDVGKLIVNTAIADRARYGKQYIVRIPQDPGAAGKIVAETYTALLAGFRNKAVAVTGSKELRATPFAAHWQNGHVQVLIADWNDAYLTQLESFPESKHDDLVDASSDSFTELTSSKFDLSALI